jgi:type IV secretion system protein TrbG
MPDDSDDHRQKSSRSKCRFRARSFVPSASAITLRRRLTGAAAIAAANAAQQRSRRTDGFLNAIQYYDYAPGVVYTAITSPGYVTTIALRPGEKLITAAAGDTVRWLVESVQSGSGESAQTLLLVKPRKADCKRICSSPPTSESTRWT